MKTLIIIKPDAVERGIEGKIIVRLGELLPDVVLTYLKAYSPLPMKQLREHYKEHEGKHFYAGLLRAMHRETAFVGVLEGPSAVSRVREAIGATNPQEATAGTIRGEFRTPYSTGPYNMIHASDSLASSIREMIIWGIVKAGWEAGQEEERDADPDLALQPPKPWKGAGSEGYQDPDPDREGG